MRRPHLSLLGIVMLLSIGCSTPTPPGPRIGSLAGPTASPDAAPTSEATWQPFRAPDNVFSVEAPSAMTEQKGLPERRFRTADKPGHVVYDVRYIDIDPRDAAVPRAQLVRMLASGLVKDMTVEYRQVGRFLKCPSEMLQLRTQTQEHIWLQVFAGRRRIYVMEVTIPSTYGDVRHVPVQRFAQSMKVDDEAPREALAEPPAAPASGHPAIPR